MKTLTPHSEEAQSGSWWKRGCELLEEMILLGWEPVSYWCGEEHMKMANVVLLIKNNSLPITDLQLKYKLPFVFHISLFLPLARICLVASLSPGICLISGAPSVKEFESLTKEPFLVLEPDIFVWSLIVLLSGGDLIISLHISLRSFQNLLMNSLAPLLWITGGQNYYCLFFLFFSPPKLYLLKIIYMLILN